MSCHKASENPFNIQWLAKHFHFDASDVKKAEFDSIGIMFEVYFKPGKEHIAKQLYQTLTDKKCHPQHYEFNNTVCLNKHQTDKIIAAAQNAQIVINQSVNHVESVNTILFQEQGEAPFNLEWLAENYNLDLTKVQEVKFNTLFHDAISIKFKPNSRLAFNAFVSTLTHVGCHPQDHGGSVEIAQELIKKAEMEVSLGKWEKEKLLEGINKAKTLILPIKDEAEINQELQQALRLARVFLTIRQSARQFSYYLSEGKRIAIASGDSSLALHEAHGHNYQTDNARIELFIKEITPFLPFLQKILSNSEYKEKIQYYFLCDKNLVLWMERCVNSTRSLYSALLDVY